jgi:far upstream element-binding protein
MADADDAPPTPPPEVVAPEEHPAVAESAVAAQQEGAATAQVDNKRKLEEAGADAEANGTGEDAKRPRVDGEPDAATGGSLSYPVAWNLCIISGAAARFYF